MSGDESGDLSNGRVLRLGVGVFCCIFPFSFFHTSFYTSYILLSTHIWLSYIHTIIQLVSHL